MFCLAGDFACSPKKQKPVIEYLLAHGAGKFSKDPTLECQYLIVGSNGSNLWKPGNYGSKVNKILKNIESGRATTRIIDETSVIGDDFGK